MNKTIFLNIVLLALLCTPVQAMELDQGFLGYRWGSDITSNESFVLKHSEGIVDYYVDESKTYSISEVDSAYVVFGAVEGQLYAVFVGIETPQGYQRALDYLRSRFGTSKVKDQGQVQEHSWSKYDFNIRIKLKKDQASGEMKMAVYYMPLVRSEIPALPEALGKAPGIHWKAKTSAPSAIPLLAF